MPREHHVSHQAHHPPQQRMIAKTCFSAKVFGAYEMKFFRDKQSLRAAGIVAGLS
jgi:hypothetical protein